MPHPQPPPDKPTPSSNDSAKPFLIFLALVVAAVTWLGVINFKEALKTETAKRNGGAWVEWLTATSSTRFLADAQPLACKGTVKSSSNTKAEAPVTEGAPGTWGACLSYILAQTDLKNLNNDFFNAPPHFVPACVSTDRTLMGALVLEDLMPTPAGSATPYVASQLLETDSIDYKMQLRLSICDKGGYPIKIAEFEF